MSKVIDLIGKKFGRLTVTQRVYPNVKKWRIMWLCECECGKEIIVDGGNLRNKHTKSCGCLKKEYGEIIGKLNKLTFGLASIRQTIRTYKLNAKKRGLEYGLTDKQFEEITQKDCYYCGAKPKTISTLNNGNGDYKYNGIDRINNNKGYIIGNIVPCCRKCNRAKDISTLQEHKNWIKKSYNYMFNKGRENI